MKIYVKLWRNFIYPFLVAEYQFWINGLYSLLHHLGFNHCRLGSEYFKHYEKVNKEK